MRSIPLAPLSDISAPELSSLLHPAAAFDRPEAVVRDPVPYHRRKTRDPLVLGVGCVLRRIATGRAAAARREAPCQF